MTHTVEVLVLDLLEWLTHGERSYRETMDAWRTSWPRLPVWEDAIDQRLVSVKQAYGDTVVRVPPAGAAFLRAHRAQQIG